MEFSRRIFLAGAAATTLPTTSFAGQRTAPVVETAYGRVRGVSRNGVHVFKAVPYGDTTAGENRFMPPRPPKPWAGVRECLDYGPQTPQGTSPDPEAQTSRSPDGYSRLYVGRPEVQSEDCLILNVWTPALDGAKRPVMFWIHGGGFSTGSGSSPWYDGTNVARKQDVVVVTINHRLNVFGYAHLGAFDERFADSANCGTLDCIAALKWVRNNIERFGGDPERVMIHGQSGGGRKTSMLLATTPAAGLYHRAVVQSGAQLRVDTLETGEAKARRLLSALNLTPDEIGKLQHLPVADIQRVQAQAARGQWMPVVGTPSLPGQPCDGDIPLMSRDVPVMIGTCRTETSGFMATEAAMDHLDEAQLIARLEAVQRGQGGALLAMYRRLYPANSNAEIAYMASSDRGYFLDSTLMATARAEQARAATYYYSFDWETPVDGGRFFAPHAVEIPFTFDSLALSEVMVGPVTPQAQRLADQVSALWASFARTGVPTAPGVPDWSPYDAERRPTLVINTESRMVDDPRGEQRRTMLAFGSQQQINGRALTPA